MAVSGVRSSWERVERNSSLTRPAASASARARCVSTSMRSRSSSLRLRSLMSRANALKLSSPSSRMAVTVSSRGKGRPSPRTASRSRRRLEPAAEVPSEVSVSWNAARKFSGRTSSARSFPTARSRGRPNVSSARGFQKVTRPAPSSAMTASSVLSRIDRTWAALERRRSATRSDDLTPLR